MDGAVLNTIRKIIAEKQARRIEPVQARYNEIAARCQATNLIADLQRLVAAGKIEEHPTIRDKSYTVVK